MARRKTSANQTSFFKREVPRMPEGYYTSGPNPNLRRFVEEHVTPYDPESDDYNAPPFNEAITSTKATAIYQMHTYWSKKPYSAIQQYIRHYTHPGDLILDPFCGSGSTALAALMEDRSVIAIDLSPAATFITKNYCTPVDTGELGQRFEKLKSKVSAELDSLYETCCDRCDGRAQTVFTIYSQVFQCPRCLEKIPLFDCMEATGQAKTGKTERIRACPHCLKRGYTEEISARDKKFGYLPVMVRYECEEGCTPQREERRHNDSVPKKRAFFTEYDLSKLKEIEERQIPCWYPTARMMNTAEDQERWGLLWRPYHAGISTVADFYTRRNLHALALLWSEIQKLPLKARAALEFAFTSIVLKCSKMMAHNSDGVGRIQKGTLYIPALIHDVNVWRFFEEAVGDFIRGYEALSIASTNLMISTEDARSLDMPSNSVDFIFTDPPYSWKVQFGESNFIWEAWLGLDTSWLDKEIIVNEVRDKDEHDWERGMRLAMEECYRVLKPGRWVSLCYHDTSEGTWQLVQDLMTTIGFIPDALESALYIDTSQKSIKQITARQVTRRDLVINFRKPRPGELIAQLTLFGGEDATTFAEKARAILQNFLESHPGSPADRLYDELVSRMVRKGEFERHDFDGLLRSVAEDPRGDGHWYLMETADQVDEAESAREMSAATRLEAFMRTYLAERPEQSGVHYSDLFEQYLPVQDKPRRRLVDWLPEYFFQTPEGTWRPPTGDEERTQKEALRTGGTLRHIKRFSRALLEGVPPHDRDRPTNVATAADWLRQCRRVGLYDYGRVLYEKGGFNFEKLGVEDSLAVEEDYQVCVRRS